MLASEVRRLARANEWQGSTRGSAPGMVQCNIAILAGEQADQFREWCRLNRSVAPVLAATEPGNPTFPSLGEDIDIRRDLPAYRLVRDGQDAVELPNIVDLWQDDWQAFAFGCSFSLEDALRAHGIPLDYEKRGFGGAIYRTNIETVPSGSMAGALVVSMRPIQRDAIDKAIAVSEHLPGLHGAPVHVGNPEKIGLSLAEPMEALGAISISADEEPVFWACGVTTHFAIENARPPIAVTHVSSRMLVTDIPIDSELVQGHCQSKPDEQAGGASSPG